eukprot:1159529-Pelagomonas_calceolata.AAC.12
MQAHTFYMTGAALGPLPGPGTSDVLLPAFYALLIGERRNCAIYTSQLERNEGKAFGPFLPSNSLPSPCTCCT